MIRRPPKSPLFPTPTPFRSRAEPPLHPDRQALAGELVHHHQHPQHLAVARAILDEVVGPDLVRALRAQPHARAVRSEEHTSELQSRQYLVCRLLLEKKNNLK